MKTPVSLRADTAPKTTRLWAVVDSITGEPIERREEGGGLCAFSSRNLALAECRHLNEQIPNSFNVARIELKWGKA